MRETAKFTTKASLKQAKDFLLKLLAINVPVFLTIILLREDSTVQQWVSTSFPVYHLSNIIMLGAQQMLAISGYHSIVWFSSDIYHYSVFAIRILGGGTVFIGFSCLGLSIMWFFASVIIASKGKLYIKTIYILSGCLLIQLLNMVRISYLTWLMRDNAANVLPGITFFRTIQTDHHDLFNYTILLVVFLLIVVWFENGIIKSVKT